MNGYIILITIFGAVVLLTAWLPTLLKSVPFSLPMACISLGAILALLPLSEYLKCEPPREPGLHGTYNGVRSDHLFDGCRIEAQQDRGLAALGGHMAIARDFHAADHCGNRGSRLELARIGVGPDPLLL